MAEVRKVKAEKKYNIDELEKNIKKKGNNKASSKKKTSKKNVTAKSRIFINGVKDETKKIHWTTKSDMLKYSVATISFIIFMSLFFYLINVIFALIQSLFN